MLHVDSLSPIQSQFSSMLLFEFIVVASWFSRSGTYGLLYNSMAHITPGFIFSPTNIFMSKIFPNFPSRVALGSKLISFGLKVFNKTSQIDSLTFKETPYCYL